MRLSYYWLPVIEVAKNCIQSSDSSYESVISRLQLEIEQVSANAVSVGYTNDQVSDAKFAIVARIDELAIGSDWQGATMWIKKPLQLVYFSTTRAGADFFIKAKEVITDEAVREVYALVLLSGFTGIYKEPEDPKLQLYRSEYLEELTEQMGISSLSEDGVMFPDSTLPNEKNGIHRHKKFKSSNRSLVAIIIIPIVCLVAMYLFFNFQINYMTKEKIKAVTPGFEMKK